MTVRSINWMVGGPSDFWNVREGLHIKPVDIAEQFAKRARAVIQQALAFFRGGLRRIADGAAPVQVLGLPGERCRPVRGQPAIVLLHGDSGGTKIRDRLVSYVLLVSRQHDRGLYRAAMN